MSRRLEIGALVALCIFLPLYEAPKSIFCVLYLVVWIVNRVRARDFGGRWDLWDSLIAAWIASGFVVAAFAGAAGGDEWRGALDLLRYGSIAWLTKRSRYEKHEIRWVLGALVASTVFGLAMGYVVLWRGHGGGLQLNSVGHVNHTAVYLAIMLGVAASWLFTAWRRWWVELRVVAVVITLLILAALVTTASRGAIGVGFVMLLVIAAAWWPRSRAPLQAAVGVFVITLLVMLASGADVLRKQEVNARSDNVLAFRSEIWSVAIATWREHPWFGVGMGNFGSSAKAKRPSSVADADYERMKEFNFPHAHSLFLNTLAERGLLGAGALGAWLLALFLALLRHRPAAADDEEAWLLWGGAVAAWMVTVGVGLVNTTLHHEHGILASMLLGLWLSRTAGR